MRKTGQNSPTNPLSYGRASCSSNVRVDEPPPYGKYFVYSSCPTASYADRSMKCKPVPKRQRRGTYNGPCHNHHAANIRTRGAHEFHNMMWDPTVYRGDTFKTYGTAELERCKNKKAGDDYVKRRKFPRAQRKIGGIVRPTVHQLQEKVGLADMGMQTEPFLEEQPYDSTAKEASTQVEREMTKNFSERNIFFKPYVVGRNSASQTDCDRTCPFEQNSKLVQKYLSEKILEQSLLETAEDTEMELLRREKLIFLQSRQEEELRIRRLVDAKRIAAAERAATMELRKQEYIVEQEAEARVGAALFSANSFANLLSETFINLTHTLSGVGCLELQEYVNADVDDYIRDKLMPSRKLLDVLIHQVSKDREDSSWWKNAAPTLTIPIPKNAFVDNETHEFYFLEGDTHHNVGNSQGSQNDPSYTTTTTLTNPKKVPR